MKKLLGVAAFGAACALVTVAEAGRGFRIELAPGAETRLGQAAADQVLVYHVSLETGAARFFCSGEEVASLRGGGWTDFNCAGVATVRAGSADVFGYYVFLPVFE